MIKTDLAKAIVAKVQENTQEEEKVIKLSQKQVNAVLEAFEDVIFDTLANDHDEYITFGRIGKFKVKEVPAKDGISAINGKAWHTDEHAEIMFKLSKVGKML